MVQPLPAFYPVGWSPDGKFAYLQDRAAEASGDMITIYTVFDTITDTVLFQSEEHDVHWAGERYHYEEAASEFQRALEEHKILAGAGITFHPFPLLTGGDRYSCEIKTAQVEEENSFHEIESYEALVYSEHPRRYHGRKMGVRWYGSLLPTLGL